MTSTPSLAPETEEVIHIPYKIERRTAELYFQLLAALLAYQDHRVTLDDIEPDGIGGWRIHFTCHKPATVELLRGLPDRYGDRSNPLWLIA
jgi:hypothetical protein